jgi:putative NAD(P)H nitroreductase
MQDYVIAKSQLGDGIMSELKDVIETRRSANNFIEGQDITIEELKEMFELTRLAPSCFNIQHVRYMVIIDKEKKSY